MRKNILVFFTFFIVIGFLFSENICVQKNISYSYYSSKGLTEATDADLYYDQESGNFSLFFYYGSDDYLIAFRFNQPEIDTLNGTLTKFFEWTEISKKNKLDNVNKTIGEPFNKMAFYTYSKKWYLSEEPIYADFYLKNGISYYNIVSNYVATSNEYIDGKLDIVFTYNQAKNFQKYFSNSSVQSYIKSAKAETEKQNELLK